MAVEIPLFLKKLENNRVSFLERNTHIPYCILSSIDAHIALFNTIFNSKKESVKTMIYLDNSASTFIKPREVIKAVEESLLHFSANPGRSGHNASIRTAMLVEETREKVAKHFGCKDPSHVIFTVNCTQALNTAILGLARSGGHVICTENEHNSVLRPLEHLKTHGKIDYSIAFQGEKNCIDESSIKACLQPNTYMVICNHISNVNGDKADIKSIGEFCKQHGLIFVLDCAQSAGHEIIDMEENNISMLAIAGHKGFYSPQGIGALVVNCENMPEPLLFGGTGTNSLELFQPDIYPERLESGTLPTPAIAGLNAGIDFVESHFAEIQNKIDDLTTFVNYELRKLGVDVYTQPENSHGVIAFNIPSLSSNEVATMLNEHWEICVRGGYHCAPMKHKALGTLESGAVRVSISYFNTFTDVQRLIGAVKTIIRKNKIQVNE